LRDERRGRRPATPATGATEDTEDTKDAKGLPHPPHLPYLPFLPCCCADYTIAMAIKDALLADYDHEMGTTRRLLERLPDDKLAWKPHEKSMSLGGLATHLSNIPQWAGPILNEAFFDVASAPPNQAEKASRAEILASFDATRKQTRDWMDKSDAEYSSMWSLRRGGQEMFSVPRVAAFRSFVLHHLIHHRGQLSVYLRLNDVPVPAIYGPSADEGF
jgi:uncharacterized damage-inducible protein DinB